MMKDENRTRASLVKVEGRTEVQCVAQTCQELASGKSLRVGKEKREMNETTRTTDINWEAMVEGRGGLGGVARGISI